MPPYPTPPETKRRGWPAWAWVTMGVVGLACLGCVAFGVLGSNMLGRLIKQVGEPAGVATGYWLALQTHDFDKAHAHFSDSLARRYSADDLQVDWRALEEHGTVTGSTFDSINVENDRATIGWVVTIEGVSYRTTLTLRNTGGQWKITDGDPGLVPGP
jgi:hypothetical protein